MLEDYADWWDVDIQTMWYSTAPKLEHLPIPKSQEGNSIWADGRVELQWQPRVRPQSALPFCHYLIAC